MPAVDDDLLRGDAHLAPPLPRQPVATAVSRPGPRSGSGHRRQVDPIEAVTKVEGSPHGASYCAKTSLPPKHSHNALSGSDTELIHARWGS